MKTSEQMLAEVAMAVAAEREECAFLALALVKNLHPQDHHREIATAERIAKRIRERGKR